MLTELAKLIQTYNFKSKEEIEKCMKEFDFKNGTFLKNFALNPTILPDIKFQHENSYLEYNYYYIPLTFLVENPSFDLWFLEGIISPKFFNDYMESHDYGIATYREFDPEVYSTKRDLLLYKIYITECKLFEKCFIPGNYYIDCNGESDEKEFLNEIKFHDFNEEYNDYASWGWINPKTMEKIDISELNFDYAKFIRLLREEVAKGKTENV